MKQRSSLRLRIFLALACTTQVGGCGNPSFLFASGEFLQAPTLGPSDPNAHVAVYPDGMEPSDAEVVGTITARTASGGCYIYNTETVQEVLKYKTRHMGADAVAKIVYQECEITTGTSKRTDYVNIGQSTTTASITSQVGITGVSAVALRVAPPLPTEVGESIDIIDMGGKWDIVLEARRRKFTGVMTVTKQNGTVFHGASTFSTGQKCEVTGTVIPKKSRVIIAAINCFPAGAPSSHELQIDSNDRMSGMSDDFVSAAYDFTARVTYARHERQSANSSLAAMER